MNREPLIHAVTLNWNRCDDTIECLTSLTQQTYTKLQLVVVDNGSTDDSVTCISTAFPEATVIANARNLGFATGANLGLRYAMEQGADFIFLLNNDTFLAPTALAQMLEHTADDVGIIAPLIFYADEPRRIWSAGGDIAPWCLEKTGDLRDQTPPSDIPEIIERDFVPGTAMLIPRRLLEEIGLFDEQFFMYYEDMDLCLRISRAGWRILVVTDAHMWHKVATSSGGADSVQERYWMARSSVLYFRKNARGLQWGAILFWRLGSAIKTTLRLIGKRRFDACRTYWMGLYHGLKGNEKRCTAS